MTEQLGGSYSKIDENSKCNIICNFIAVAVTASTVKRNSRLLEFFLSKIFFVHS